MCHMCRRRSPRQTTPNVPPISAPPPHPTVTSQPQPRLRYCQYSRNRFSCKCSDPGSHLRLVSTPGVFRPTLGTLTALGNIHFSEKTHWTQNVESHLKHFSTKTCPCCPRRRLRTTLLPSATLARCPAALGDARASVAEGSRGMFLY